MRSTRTPIKHVIVIVGENRSFDHVFATYKPKHGQHVDNLLSKKIINEDGTPGPEYSLAAQYSADITGNTEFQLSPTNKTPYSTLPAPLKWRSDGCLQEQWNLSLADAEASENGLPDATYYGYLTSGGTGLSGKVPDTRITGVIARLLTPPFLADPSNSLIRRARTLLHGILTPPARFTASTRCGNRPTATLLYATESNPSGCKSDLFTWTAVTVGSNVNGLAQPFQLSTDYSPAAKTTGEGGTVMGFYNVLQGDMPYFKQLADNYSMSDNYHQPAMGGTGLDSIMLGLAMRSGSATQ